MYSIIQSEWPVVKENLTSKLDSKLGSSAQQNNPAGYPKLAALYIRRKT